MHIAGAGVLWYDYFDSDACRVGSYNKCMALAFLNEFELDYTGIFVCIIKVLQVLYEIGVLYNT